MKVRDYCERPSEMPYLKSIMLRLVGKGQLRRQDANRFLTAIGERTLTQEDVQALVANEARARR